MIFLSEQNRCFFCSKNLDKIDITDKITLDCCGISCHKKELYFWFNRKEKCPNCQSSDKQLIQEILEWGNRKKKKKKRVFFQNKDYKKWTKINYTSILKETRNKKKKKK